jgi:sec-independent protein translocase protein TatC
MGDAIDSDVPVATRPPDDKAMVVSDPSEAMPLVDHLAELRRRVAVSVLAIAIGSVIGFLLAEPIIKLLLTPLPDGEVVFLTLGGGFMVYLRVAIVVGLLIALPVVLYELWAFVAPGLLPQERRAALPWIPMSVVFFLIGTIVAWVTLPYAVNFLLGFQIQGSLVALPSAEAYFSFVTIMFLLFGLVMQFPIVLIFLDRLGILHVDQLREMRRYVLLGVVIFAVVVTPGGDPISPIVLSATMYALYEFTIFFLRRRGRDEVSSDVNEFSGND